MRKARPTTTCRRVRSVSHPLNAATVAGRLLALAGLAAAFASTFWSWGYTRLSQKFERRSTPAAEAAAKTTSTLRIGRAINLIGMGLSIVGAEAIIGTLAAKTLTQGAVLVAGASGGSGFVQARGDRGKEGVGRVDNAGRRGG